MKHLALIATIVLCLYVPASAGLIVKAGDVTVTASPTDAVDGFLDVYFHFEDPMPVLPEMQGFDVAVDLSPFPASVTLGAPQNPTDPHAPLLAGAIVDLTPMDLEGQRIQATNFDLAKDSAVTITNGAGIVRVPFQVAAGTTGVFNVTIDTGRTILTDDDQLFPGAIAYTPDHGTITVLAVPEPSSLAIVVVSFISLAARRARRFTK